MEELKQTSPGCSHPAMHAAPRVLPPACLPWPFPCIDDGDMGILSDTPFAWSPAYQLAGPISSSHQVLSSAPSQPPTCARCVQARLLEERAKLEAAVSAQIEQERVVLLERKRREQVQQGACQGQGLAFEMCGV